MRKLSCNICDGCRIVLSRPWHTVRGKKRELEYCDKCFGKKYKKANP